MSTCPYCHAPGLRLREFQIRGSETLNLEACRSCECEYLFPQPSDEWLAHEYSGYFQMRQGRTPSSKARLCQMMISKLTIPAHNAHVLEIGGGEGHFVHELIAKYPSCSITLVEPQVDGSRFPAQQVSVHNMLIEEWLNSQPPVLHDAVVAMDLLEHLRNPVDVLQNVVATRLKPGGTLIVTTPDAASLFRRVMGRFWPHYKVEHLTYPSPRALRHVATDSELEIVELKSLAKPLHIGYIITILKNFGPQPIRILGKFLDAICPTFIRRWHVRIPSGEILFVAKRTALSRPD